ncbi:dihydroorotase [Maritalea porphyrae]|jgi:dihydroorotase|uniref:dihydroorotase n=1 Tax=Maritalea porphyrae TaxID=880732 RepID=UPI0022AE7628|nr:dihydroorotase [Maritalea porphyrae]MCZ4272916.1 dihydroorotase [Maritalea porphyrae]
MSNQLVIKNARIIDPASNTDMHGSILIKNGKFAKIIEGEIELPEGATVHDAQGRIIAPGLVDLRVFTGEPGREYRETLKTASNAAAAGGVTSALIMPDTNPVLDDAALIDFVARRARDTAEINFYPAAAISKGLEGQDIAEFGLLKEAGAKAFTDGRNSIQNPALLKTAFTYAQNFDMPIIHHVSDANLTGSGVMNAGLLATGLGLKGIPHIAETIPLDRDVQLAEATGVRYHAAQISCAKSAEIIARAKKHSKRISAGISINNLCLNENDIGDYRTFFKLAPPLRSEDERQAMIAALVDGTIDVIHSAHDPQDMEGKRRPFAEAVDGAVGLETMLSAALRLVHEEQIDLISLLRTMSTNPADLLGIDAGRIQKGAPADFIEIDLDYPWVVSENDLKSRSQNTAFEGARFSGKVTATFVSGTKIYELADA